MRIWTIHPSCLDAKGLVAAWREGLLAQKVLEGRTIGYARHPQLTRFKDCGQPLQLISLYLLELWTEACERGYRFDSSKIRQRDEGCAERIGVNEGQLLYELELLKWKLERRAPERLALLPDRKGIRINGAFERRPGGVEAWERPIAEILARSLSKSRE